MKILLSAMGWLDDAPRGNRLRWHFPVADVLPGGAYRGLPKRIVIERAPIGSRDVYKDPMGSAAYPYDWWEPLPDVFMAGFVAPQGFTLPRPVQAIRFVYEGSPGRLVIRDAQHDGVVYDRPVADGDVIYVEGTFIDTVDLYGAWGRFIGVRVLDLFRDHQLRFEQIAEITVAATYTKSLPAIAPRYTQEPTMSAAEWSELVDVVESANASSLATEELGTPTAWDAFQILLGLRWEFALLGGFAFFDGPRERACDLDHLGANILKELPPSGFLAYRVRNPDNAAEVSNLVVCAAWLAPPLTAPGVPAYVDPEVRLREGKTAMTSSAVLGSSKSLANYTPTMTFDGDYNVRGTMRWTHSDVRALGVEIEEVVSASPATGVAARTRTFMSRSRRIDDPPLTGTLARNFEVPFVDVTLRARARALDAWDRVSGFSAWCPPTPLILRHEPMAPPLESGHCGAHVTRLQRAVGRLGVPDWQADPIVRQSGGQVYVYRRTVKPRVAEVTISLPVPVSPGLYRASVTGAAQLSDFVGGSLTVGGFTDTIDAVGATTVDFVIPNNGDSVALFSAGLARLSQDPMTPSLWTHVATFPAVGLPVELVFSEVLPPPSGLVVESYATRVAFLGRLGPLGTMATAIRTPEVPVVPPPFTVDVLGIDFYRRTIIRLRFTTPPVPGRYTVWWTDGQVAATDLPKRGAPGAYAAQTPTNGNVLFEVLPLPIPSHVDRAITMGVQQVLDGGVQGDFVTAQIVLPALSP